MLPDTPRPILITITTAAIGVMASCITTITVPTAGAQHASAAATTAADTAPPFARARRLSDADLAEKREGRFLTGLPDLSSDPVAGFGYGARVNVIWNGA